MQNEPAIAQTHPELRFIWKNFGEKSKGRGAGGKQIALAPVNKRGIQRRWECPECSYSTTHGGHFTQHLKIHDKQNRIKCAQDGLPDKLHSNIVYKRDC